MVSVFVFTATLPIACGTAIVAVTVRQELGAPAVRSGRTCAEELTAGAATAMPARTQKLTLS
jgi:hypothetical protein